MSPFRPSQSSGNLIYSLFGCFSVQTTSPRHGAILELQKRTNETQNNVFMVKGIECWQKYEPHYGSCRQFLWKNHASASVVNELFFHLILKLERHQGRSLVLQLHMWPKPALAASPWKKIYNRKKSHVAVGVQRQRKNLSDWCRWGDNWSFFFLFIAFTGLNEHVKLR